jgi:hypothetical protein
MNTIKIVENFMINNPMLKLSVKSIAKQTGLHTKHVTFLCHKSKLLRQVLPREVGSGKSKMNTFTLI